MACFGTLHCTAIVFCIPFRNPNSTSAICFV